MTMPGSTESIRCTRAAGVATLSIARPQQRNALSSAMLHAMLAHLDEVAADDAIRVVVLASEGETFCSGFDLAEFDASADAAEHATAVRLFNRVARRLLGLPQPVIARVQGIATAGGSQLVAACDLAVASECARFATSSILLGVYGAAPAVLLSRDMGRKAAFEMLVTGDFVDAHEAKRLGLVNRVVESTRLDAEVSELATRIAARPATAVRLGKQFFHRQLEMGVDAAHQLAAETMAANLQDEETRALVRGFVARQPRDS